VPKADLVAAFNKHLADSRRPAMTKTAFGLAIKRARPVVEASQRTWHGRVTEVYTGIGMATKERAE